MKAKKLIAIGLVATMTLGMSTSVFAGIPYQNYSDEPQFENWDTEFGPDDNAYHAKGQGWLEGGEGINESAVNVLVPTTPNVNIKRGEPGLFDFGFDPQRLVKRTTHAKYDGKEIFTAEAMDTGVYFINEPEEVGTDLNSFDNKSVKYEATNIGTEPLALTVKATLSGGQNFTYLEEEPEAEAEAVESGPVGMFLGLNVATGEENGEYSNPTETPFLVAEATGQNNDSEPAVIDAAAEFTQVVNGNPDNYTLKWDSGTKTYRYMMKPSTGEGARTEPFETVAFWFRGAATYNKTVPADLTVPALDFTWSFSQKIPDAPKLVSVNGTAVTEIPQEFTDESFDENGKIALAFDTGIAAVDYATDPASATWNPIDSEYYTIDGKTLTIKISYLNMVQGNPKYVRVKFAGTGETCILKFCDYRN